VNAEKLKLRSECHEEVRPRKLKRKEEGEEGEVSALIGKAAGD
jgi:hypothetical protein